MSSWKQNQVWRTNQPLFFHSIFESQNIRAIFRGWEGPFPVTGQANSNLTCHWETGPRGAVRNLDCSQKSDLFIYFLNNYFKILKKLIKKKKIFTCKFGFLRHCHGSFSIADIGEKSFFSLKNNFLGVLQLLLE